MKDIAKVVVSQEDVINLGFHNGNPATTIAISKSVDGSTVEINQKIMTLLHRMKKTMPSNMEYKRYLIPQTVFKNQFIPLEKVLCRDCF